MTIAIDLDGTFSADIACFKRVADVFREFGHDVICVTARTPETRDECERILDGSMPLYMTSHEFKRDWMKKHHGICVDIFVDDICSEITPCKDCE